MPIVDQERKRQLRKEVLSDTVKDASLTQTYSFLPASGAGDTHEETNFLPIGDREEEERCLNRCTDSLETMQVFVAEYLQTRVFPRGKERQRRLDC